MGLKNTVSSILTNNIQMAYRPSQTYLVATSTYTLWSISSGAIEVITLGARITGTAVGATTVAMTLNTVAGDAGAVAINGAVGTVVYYGVNVGATLINAASVPKTVATMTTMIVGTQPAGPGLIVATFGVGTSVTCEWFMAYRKLSPSSNVS